MEILFAATELSPFAKVGGLADVMASLPKALRQLGHNLTVVLPRLPLIEKSGVPMARRLTPLAFELGGKSWEVTVYDGRLPSGVDLIALDAPGLFDRDGIYGGTNADFADNPLRFGVFSRAVTSLLQQRHDAGTGFDIVHLHDWPTALVALYLKRFGSVELQESCKSVLTIHNLAFQGSLEREAGYPLGLEDDLFHPEGIEFYGKINILKAGMKFADVTTTVSETYAREICKPGSGCGLEGVIASLQPPLLGITNGIDALVWNPATDPHIASRYDAESPFNKIRCKAALLSETGLSMSIERPVVAFVGRFHEQKGIDLVMDSLSELVRHEVSVVLVGEGSEGVSALVKKAIERCKDSVVWLRQASDEQVHRVFAGADLLLVPSRVEPCGLVQRCAQRYGCIPVVHATGGLIDTVVDCDSALETGTGFVFDQLSASALVGAVQRALAGQASGKWAKLVRRVMHQEVGWERPARRYEQVYKSLHQ